MNLAQTDTGRRRYQVKKTEEIIYEFYAKHFPELVDEWGNDFNIKCPIHPSYLRPVFKLILSA